MTMTQRVDGCYVSSDHEVVTAAITSRRSIRAFLPTPLDLALVNELLRIAGTAPSGSNIQPWQVHAVAGATRHKPAAARLAAPHAGQPAGGCTATWASARVITRRPRVSWGATTSFSVRRSHCSS